MPQMLFHSSKKQKTHIANKPLEAVLTPMELYVNNLCHLLVFFSESTGTLEEKCGATVTGYLYSVSKNPADFFKKPELH